MARDGYNEFKRQYEFIARSKSTHTAFDEFLDFSLLLFKAERTIEENEKINELSSEYLPMFEKLGEAADDNKEDVLGELFMEYLSYGKNGQFFTPMPICLMLAKMTMAEDQEEKHVCDPACGSGRTLLAAGLSNRNLWLYGSDLDHRCVKMTVLNMLIHTMRGEVAHMNTLTMEHWHSYHIHRLNIGGMFMSTWTESGPGETRFIERLKKTQEKQVQIESTEAVPQPKQGQLILF